MNRGPTTRWVHAAYPQALAESLAADVAKQLWTSIRDRGVATMAVPGGTTPRAFLQAIGAHPLEWDKVFLTLTDERWVDDDHPRSNLRMLTEALAGGPAAAARIIPIAQSDVDVHTGAAQWHPPAFEGPFDVVILGVGTDGHTASLFPGTASFAASLLASDDVWAWPVTDAPQPEPRVSLTPTRLGHTRWLGVLAHGQAKRLVLEDACSDGPVDALPLRWFLRRNDLTPRIYHAPEAHA